MSRIANYARPVQQPWVGEDAVPAPLYADYVKAQSLSRIPQVVSINIGGAADRAFVRTLPWRADSPRSGDMMQL